MEDKEKRAAALLKRAEAGAYDPQSDETPAEAEKLASDRDRALDRYRAYYDDVKQHGGVLENAYRSEDW